MKFEFCDFEIFFEIFKKASRGPSVADLEHYGRGQTRLVYGLVTKFRQNRLTLKGRSAGQRHTDRQTGANFKIYLLHQFCSNRVKLFLQYTGDTDAKNDGPEF